MTTQPISSVPTDVAGFVAQVRAALADLPADDVDELTAGLAADLADARAESPDAWREGVGSPMVYAAELRSAAGLPPRVTGSSERKGLADLLHDRRQAWQRSPLYPAARRWYGELRPGGWVLRGFIAGWLLVGWVTGSSLLATALVSLPFVVVSVWIGLEARRGQGWARLLGGIGAGFAVFFGVLLGATQWGGTGGYEGPSYASADLNNGGAPIGNVYGFDADGNRVDGLRLFDQDGRPIRTHDFYGAEITAFPGIPDPGVQGDPWVPLADDLWTPPLTIPPVFAGGGAVTSTDSPTSTTTATLTSASDPTRSSSGSSTSSTSRSGSEEDASPSPRSTSSQRSTSSPSR